MSKFIFFLLVFTSFSSAETWIGFEILNDPFDYFFSLIATMSFLILAPSFIIKIFSDL